MRGGEGVIKKSIAFAKLIFWISVDIVMKFLFGTIIIILYIVKLPFDLIGNFTKHG